MKLKQTCLIILNKFWQLLAALIILFAVLISIARISIPYINNHRVTIEKIITDRVGVDVRIGYLEGRWEALGPVLEIQDVSLGPESGIKTVIKSIKVGISPLPSLFYRTLITDNMTIDGLSVALEQQLSGKFVLSNFSNNTDSSPDRKADLASSIQNWLQHQSRLLLLNTNIDISLRDGNQYPISIDVINFIRGKNAYQLIGYSDLPGKNQIIFRAEADGSLTDPSTKGQLYIDSNQIDMTELPLNAFWNKTAIDSGALVIKLWADWKEGGFDSALMSLNVLDFQLSLNDEQQIDLEKLDSYLVWNHLSDGWVLESQQTEIISQGRTWPDPSLLIRMKETGNQQNYNFSASRLDLGIWADLLLTHPTLDTNLRQQLLAMDVKGFLSDTRVNAVVADFSLIDLRANAFFSEVSFRPWEKIPGVTNLGGQVEFNRESGALFVDSRQTILDYPSVFRWPFNLDSINGHLSWGISDDLFSLEISNFFTDISGTQLMADGIFDFHRNSRLVDMNLYAELENGDIAKTRFFLPNGIMKEKLVNYLDQSIQSGRLESTQISLRGPSTSFPFTNADGVFAVNAQAKNARYSFLENWPEITDIDADLWFVGNSMDIRVRKANSNGQNISEAVVAIENFKAKPPILTVKSTSQGETESGMDYINNSPLKDSIGKIFDVIPTKGPFELDLDLYVPLSKGADLKVNGEVNLLGNSMLVKPVEMAVNNIQGKILITDSLLSAKNISAEVMGGKSTFELKREFDHQGQLSTTILGDGMITSSGVRKVFPDWIPGLLEGKTAYDIRILLPEIDEDDSNSALILDINLTSNLEGIISYFPEPFQKKSQQAEPFHFNYQLLNNKQQIFSSTLSDWADIKLHIQNKDDLSGRIIFGGEKASISSHEGIELSGQFDYLDLEAWLALLKRPEISIDEIEFSNLEHLFIKNLLIKDLRFYSMNFNDVILEAKQDNNNLHFNLDSKMIAGKINIPDPDLETPIDINLSKLVLPDLFPATEVADTTEQIKDKLDKANTQPLPALRIFCEKCTYNKQSFGLIKANINPIDNGNTFAIKSSGANLLKLDVKGEWKKDSEDKVFTTISGDLNTSRPGKLLNTFNLQTGIRKTKLKTSGQISWQGDPAQFNFQTLNGNISLNGGKGSQKDISDKGARIFSLFSVGSVIRRLSLDFSDLFGKGFHFDRMKGNFAVTDGAFSTNDFEIAGTSADVELKGVTDFSNNQIEKCIRVTPKLGSSLPILAGWAIEPVTGLVVYLMSKIIQPALKVVTSILYKVEGPIDNPEIIEVRKTSGTAVVDNTVVQGKTTITPDSEILEFNCDEAFNK